MTKQPKILIIGALGQIGTELTTALSAKYGEANVFPSDIARENEQPNYIALNALQHDRIEQVVLDKGITQIYLLAAMLSANGEKDINAAWTLNVQSLMSVLQIARDHKLDKIFWPSSIAIFGPTSAKHNCRQHARAEPITVYGISKKAGEHFCNYYFENFGVDVRSLRFPGLISHTAPPGGGTTDYAVDIYHKAIRDGHFNCFLEEDCCLPMMYMPDAIRATLELMEAPKEKISIRTSYNIAGMSFAPCDIAAAIRDHIPGFTMQCAPDFRQAIAESWPASVDDTQAGADWGWEPAFNLENMTADMLQHIKEAHKAILV
ncbi:NAD-dependent epimerase/dehydratase family protein [Mucilaginibacter corticis]|uniref:NAD-dependent epimerase/dehydratase family protein n=1 Tax=Mucilaginibacter corticis TaxID=2597670 RepID=A0A556M9M0_9SPHI|nr:NAD-dependent epimerase/dehydratase family protein [Mucilaginibacter corticis]TSJ36592.1 NAD-dependent epimerase/dehydratase family protein [Mucilaginibacter corticis]